jgi:hypothetical protein
VTRLLPFAGAALGGALVLALVLALTGAGDGTTTVEPAAAKTATWTAGDGSFSIALPVGWKAVADGSAATVVRRADKRGVVVIRRRAAVTVPLERLAGRLERKLRREIDDFKPVGSRIAPVGGARGLVYTFARPVANQVQSVVVAPAGNVSYTLDLVADGDAPDVARELAAMVRSFAPKRRGESDAR